MLVNILPLIPYRYSVIQLTATSFWSFQWVAGVIAVRKAFVLCTVNCKAVEEKLVSENGPLGQLIPIANQ